MGPKARDTKNAQHLEEADNARMLACAVIEGGFNELRLMLESGPRAFTKKYDMTFSFTAYEYFFGEGLDQLCSGFHLRVSKSAIRKEANRLLRDIKRTHYKL